MPVIHGWTTPLVVKQDDPITRREKVIAVGVAAHEFGEKLVGAMHRATSTLRQDLHAIKRHQSPVSAKGIDMASFEPTMSFEELVGATLLEGDDDTDVMSSSSSDEDEDGHGSKPAMKLKVPPMQLDKVKATSSKKRPGSVGSATRAAGARSLPRSRGSRRTAAAKQAGHNTHHASMVEEGNQQPHQPGQLRQQQQQQQRRPQSQDSRVATAELQEPNESAFSARDGIQHPTSTPRGRDFVAMLRAVGVDPDAVTPRSHATLLQALHSVAGVDPDGPDVGPPLLTSLLGEALGGHAQNAKPKSPPASKDQQQTSLSEIAKSLGKESAEDLVQVTSCARKSLTVYALHCL